MEFIRVFEPDEDYDIRYASDGVSRYGAYLSRNADLFDHDGDLTTDAARFAAAAWRIAHPPTMCPGYVSHHGRVQDTSTRWDDEGRLAVTVELAVSASPEVTAFGSWRHWSCDDHGRWTEPTDLVAPIAVTVVRVAIPLAGVRLPQPRYHRRCPDTTTAKRAVQAFCVLLNHELAAIVASDPLTRTAS